MSHPEYERLKGILAAIAYTQPEITLVDALKIVPDVEQALAIEDWGQALTAAGASWLPDDTTPTHIAAKWCETQSTVMMYLPDRKIQAIKEARSLSKMGLRAAKEAIEAIPT